MKKGIGIWDDMAKSFHALSLNSRAHKDKYLTIAKIIMDANPKNILDLGCGSGLLESELIKLGYKGDMCAVDASSEMLKIAKSICGDKVDFKQIDLDEDFNINCKFEVIVVINVLFFIKNKKVFISKIYKLLSEDNSILVLVNPKPNKEANNWEFIKAHFSNTTLKDKFLITINELINIPRYFRMIRSQSYLSKMANRGLIVFDDKENIKNIVISEKFNIEKIEDIHAGQNWLIVMRKSQCE